MAEHKYHIRDGILKPAKHHESFKQLWETKWKMPASMGVYPFMFGTTADFQPVVDSLIKADLKEPYDWDEYAAHYFPQAQKLTAIAEEAERNGETEKASEYYLRASAVYRIARFPTFRSAKQREAWVEGKKVFYKGGALANPPMHEVSVPHVHGIKGEGEAVLGTYCLPPNASASSPVPLILIITGLDGYRTELATWSKGFAMKGMATLIHEIPGTGDSPALRQDPTSPDRQWKSVLDWVAQQKELDSKKVIVWGFSTGGYYALRIAHTEHDRLLASVSLGGGAHHMFDRDWLENVNKLEYPFDLANTLTYKFGYKTLEEFIQNAQQFSLVNDKTLEKPCCRMLLVNGDLDEIFPIEDLWVALAHGAPKEARIVNGKKHMGEPDSFFIILKWIYGLLGIEGNFMDQMKTLPFKAKY